MSRIAARLLAGRLRLPPRRTGRRRLATSARAAADCGHDHHADPGLPPTSLPPTAVDAAGHLPTASPGRRLFYVLQEASNPGGTESCPFGARPPVAVWLQGGPGASALTGCFHEHGRWTTHEATGRLHRNKDAWADAGMHVLYVEQPGGTGFSDAGPAGPPATVREAAADLAAALTAFFTHDRPDLAACPLLLTGESHAGRFCPDAAAAWLDASDKSSPSSPLPRLAGVAVGNSFTDPRSQTLTLAPRLHAAGLLDARGAAAAAARADRVAALIDAGAWRAAHDERQALLDWLTEACVGKEGTLLNVERTVGYDARNTVTALLAGRRVREQLGLSDAHPPWVRKSAAVRAAMWEDKMVSSVPAVERVLAAGVPALFFQGVHDAQDGPFSNEPWIEAMAGRDAWSGAGAYRAAKRRPVLRGGAPVAFARSGGGLTTVALRHAGHMAARDAAGATRWVVAAWARAAVGGGEVAF